MEDQYQPFFNRGPSIWARLVFFTFLCLVMMVSDAHFRYLSPLRDTLSVILYPMQKAAFAPVVLAEQVSGFFVTHGRMQRENAAIKQARLADAKQLLLLDSLKAENAHLRKLLSIKHPVEHKAILSEIVYAGHDPYSRKVIIDKGDRDGIKAGQAVIDNIGVIGQVTRAQPLSSEVTLLTDKDQAVPVQVLRSGLRGIVYGMGQGGLLDMRFVPLSADIQNGDVLVTSGIDGVYPAGLPVAVVSKIERNSAYSFAKIFCTPSAGVDRNRQMVVLTGAPAYSAPALPATSPSPPPVAAPAPPAPVAASAPPVPAAPPAPVRTKETHANETAATPSR